MSDLSPLCAPKRTFANASGFIGSRPGDIRFGSGVFAPPIRPPDPVRRTSGPHDGPLIEGTESPIEASQRGLDQPRLEPLGEKAKAGAIPIHGLDEVRLPAPEHEEVRTAATIATLETASRGFRFSEPATFSTRVAHSHR
jgi:hypothetical protein